mmetsp:Transcript_45930/g.107148  ORF Transcript_45930/g.107148 Transcript_45930/m.107148 type:complete len:240 (+) Transcript_45930:285-1004(+)
MSKERRAWASGIGQPNRGRPTGNGVGAASGTSFVPRAKRESTEMMGCATDPYGPAAWAVLARVCLASTLYSGCMEGMLVTHGFWEGEHKRQPWVEHMPCAAMRDAAARERRKVGVAKRSGARSKERRSEEAPPERSAGEGRCDVPRHTCPPASPAPRRAARACGPSPPLCGHAPPGAPPLVNQARASASPPPPPLPQRLLCGASPPPRSCSPRRLHSGKGRRGPRAWPAARVWGGVGIG